MLTADPGRLPAECRRSGIKAERILDLPSERPAAIMITIWNAHFANHTQRDNPMSRTMPKAYDVVTGFGNDNK